MSGVVTALTGTNGLSATTIFSIVSDLAPLLLIIIPASLGLYFLRKIIKGVGNKGKVRF